MCRPLVAMLALLLLPSIVSLPPRAATPPGPYAVTDLGVFDPKITVNVKGDRTRAPEEVFYVNLSGATGAVIQSGQGTGVVRNDDR